MLINGVILCYFSFSKQLSSYNQGNRLIARNIGLGMFSTFTIVFIVPYVIGNFQWIEYIIWVGTVIEYSGAK